MAQEIKDGLLSNYLRAARFKRVIPHIKAGKLLDIGCDQGYIIPYLPEGIEYFGIERNETLFNKARTRYPQHSFFHMDVTADSTIKIKPTDFDTILMIAVIEHMDKPMDVLDKLRSMLNKKGRIVITSPSRKSHKLLVMLSHLGLARKDKHEHQSYVNNKTMSRLFVPGKFKLILHKRFQFGLNQLWVLERTE